MKYQTLITDVDNTLFDWLQIWHAAFSAMISTVSDLLDIEQTVLIPDIKAVHQKHGTSEYAYLLEELPAILALDDQKKELIITEGNRAFAQARLTETKLYPGVLSTLRELKSRGINVVAFTESYGVYTAYRFQACGIDGLVDDLFSPENHRISTSRYASLSHSHVDDHVLENTRLHYTPAGEVKPNPAILRDITNQIGAPIGDCVYVGDNLMKDIAMAQQVGMLDVHAAYGGAQHRAEYELLKLVTHWPDSVVKKEQSTISDNSIIPSVTLNNGFHEILQLF